MKESKTYDPPDFLRPFHLLTFALVLKAGNWKGVTLPENLENYAIRMGLYEAAGIPPPKTIHKYSSAGRFHPVIPLVDARTVAVTAARLSALCANQLSTKETQDSLETSISELLENCYAHAGRRFYGLAAGQIWQYGNLAQIAIADTGVGIRARLMDNPNLHALLRTFNACELATRYGITADESGHGGYGLTLAKDLLRSNGGNLMVISKDEVAVGTSKGMVSSKFKSSVRWNGTLVIFEWNTNRTLDVRAVYRGWPNPRGYDDDEFM